MAMEIKQFRFYGKDSLQNYPNNEAGLQGESFFNTLCNGKLFPNHVNGAVIKLGIQGRPNTIFNLNGGTNIYIGDTGIYEIDLEGLGTIQTIQFDPDSLQQYSGLENVNSRLLIDIVYEGSGGNA